MSQRLELPEALYAALKEAAEASGTTPVGWIASRLGTTGEPGNAAATTLAELFAGRTGRIRSGGRDVLSENCGQRFAAHCEERRREGRL